MVNNVHKLVDKVEEEEWEDEDEDDDLEDRFGF